MGLQQLRNYIFLIIALIHIAFSAHAEPKHAIAMFGEPKYPSNFTHFDYTNPDAPKGGDVRYAAIGTFDSLNPYILKGISASGLGLTSDTLTTSSQDEPFSAYGLLAETIDVADDRSSVTFTLRKEAKWHDGSPVTADDVVFSFDTLMTKGHPIYRTYYHDVSGAEKTSDRQVKFTFATTENRELPLIVGQLPIISKAYYEKHDFEKSTLDAPLGNGAYKVKEVKAAHYIVYERDPHYWGKDLAVNKGRYNFDTLRYDYYRDSNVAVEAFKAGQYDIREENISKVWANAYDDMPALKEGKVIKEEIRHQIPTGMQAFVFNTRRSYFANPKVREALNYAFDFEWTNQKLFYGAYTRTESYFSNSDFASSGLPDEAELTLLDPLKEHLPEALFTTEFDLPETQGDGNNRTQLRKASNLLDEAGFVIKDKKRIDPATGKQLSIEFMLVSPSFERVVAPMIKNLEKLGISARIRTVDSAQYQKRLETFDYDIIVNSFGQSNSPGNEQKDYWHSSRANMEGSKNYIGIQNPAVDALVETLIGADTKEELMTAAHALDRVLLWNYYVIPNWHIRSFRVIHWDKFNRPKISPKYALGVDTWWAKDAK